MKSNSTITLKKVSRSDYAFLYELLKNRDPISNISHKKMPTFEEHISFIKSKPYSHWYVIYHDGDKAGSIYLTKQDEIGIFIKKELQGKGIASKALKILIDKNPRKRYLANIAPKNKKSTAFFTKKGFKLIQYTYELSFGKVK